MKLGSAHCAPNPIERPGEARERFVLFGKPSPRTYRTYPQSRLIRHVRRADSRACSQLPVCRDSSRIYHAHLTDRGKDGQQAGRKLKGMKSGHWFLQGQGCRSYSFTAPQSCQSVLPPESVTHFYRDLARTLWLEFEIVNLTRVHSHSGVARFRQPRRKYCSILGQCTPPDRVLFRPQLNGRREIRRNVNQSKPVLHPAVQYNQAGLFGRRST
jgi:hypothetical protein